MARRSSERPTYGFTVAPVVDAVPAARRQVVSLAQDLGLPMSDQTLETVELLAGEVIANAVLYTGAPCGVAVTRADERLRVEVTDADASLPSAVEAGPNDESGRGLLLVNALADAWGTQPESPGKTTWFEITSEASTNGLGNDSAEAPPSPHAGEPAVRRTECPGHMVSPANSRSSFVPGTAGKQHQAA
ncbi:ATP-binding protein [Streptomyces xinghaiensis]|uniref:ATP-binding protein n=1 Tax=Streptomyces xinghaiensis TaxID=1038928 RepID=UPI003789CE11